MNDQAPDRYVVLGNPVGHSRSPLIHAEFAHQCGQAIDYRTLEAPLDGLASTWQAFVEAGGKGANVTVPFKGDAFALCDTLSERARRAEAVNTLIVGTDGRLYGDTTDGVGLSRDLSFHRVSLIDKRVLVLGAGGAVQGVIEGLLEAGPDELLIANRTARKAEAVAARFQDLGAVRGGGLGEIEGPFDLVINGTSASLGGELPPLPDALFNEGAWAYDMMYGVEPTVFLTWAGARGAHLLDGLGMLVEQAAESFFMWRGVRPDTGPVREALRRSLAHDALR